MLFQISIFAKAEPVFKHFQGKGFTSIANAFVLEMDFLIRIGKSILPKEKHRQKGET